MGYREAWLEPPEERYHWTQIDRAQCTIRDHILGDADEISELIADGVDPARELVAIFKAIESATNGNQSALTEVTAAAWQLFTKFRTEATERAEKTVQSLVDAGEL